MIGTPDRIPITRCNDYVDEKQANSKHTSMRATCLGERRFQLRQTLLGYSVSNPVICINNDFLLFFCFWVDPFDLYRENF